MDGQSQPMQHEMPHEMQHDTSQQQEVQSNPDLQISMKIKSVVMSDSNLSAAARFVSVSTQDGVVTLTGTVSSENDSHMLESKVKSITGVKEVNNQLMIGA